MLQRTSDDTPARTRSRVEDWYRPRLGKFLCVNKDGVLCRPEHNRAFCPRLNLGGQYVPSPIPGQPQKMGGDIGDDRGNGSTSPAVQMESLGHDSLAGSIGGAGIFWPSPAQAPNSGQYASQTSDTVDELVFSLFSHAAILSDCRNWDAFYDNFLNQISDLAGDLPRAHGLTEGGGVM